MPERRIGCDRRRAGQYPQARGEADRHRRDQAQGELRRIVRHGGHEHAQGLDRRQAGRRRQHAEHIREHRRTHGAERPVQRRLAEIAGHETLPQRARHPFEAALPRDLVERIAAQHQPPGRPIHLAQHGFGGHHAIEAARIHPLQHRPSPRH